MRMAARIAFALALLASASSFAREGGKLASGRPATGDASEGGDEFDAAIDEFMTRIGATAATFALMKEGEFVHRRGYGYSDARGRRPTSSATPMRLASNSKPFTAAVVHQLIDEGKIGADTPVFAYLGLAPHGGRLGDPRLAEVTVGHLLAHSGGWDREETFDPLYAHQRIAEAMKLPMPPNQVQIIQYMLAQPLQFAPGERRCYSNFGYLLLGRVVEKATGKTFLEALTERIARPLGVDVRGSATSPRHRHPGEAHYPREPGVPMESRDSSGGLIASASALCVFMTHYWANGERRREGERRIYRHFGSLPNCTTCLMEQRGDGIVYAVVINSRRNGSFQADNELLRETLTGIIDRQMTSQE